jgi:hypothetical protein
MQGEDVRMRAAEHMEAARQAALTERKMPVDPNGFDEEDLPVLWYEDRHGCRPSWAANLSPCVLLLVSMHAS